MNSTSGQIQLPASLSLSPHLSAQKYFFVCTLTVAAWDTLVLSPRSWRLLKTPGWPALKIMYFFLAIFMPIEFVITGVMFFDTNVSLSSCQAFYLFEPICTAILLAVASAVHIIRVHAIYDKNRTILAGLGALFAVQIVVTAVCCGFYHSVPLLQTQGCIAGPKNNASWVAIYWLAPTLLYTASGSLAIARSVKSLRSKPIRYWKLMLRDGLNLYIAIWLINMVNMIFYFSFPPTGINDPIKTIVTSMAAVLTASMTMRIILSVRGALTGGGVYMGSASTGNSSSASGSIGIASRSTRSRVVPTTGPVPTFTLDRMQTDGKEGEWVDTDAKSSVKDGKDGILPIGLSGEDEIAVRKGPLGVQVTVDKTVEYDASFVGK